MSLMRVNKIPFAYKDYKLYLQNDLDFLEVKFLKDVIDSDDNIDIAFNTTMFKTYILFNNRYNQRNRFLIKEYKLFRLFILSFIFSCIGERNNTCIIVAYTKHIYYFRMDEKDRFFIGEFRKFDLNTKEFNGHSLIMYDIFPSIRKEEVYDVFHNIMRYVNRNLF